MIQTKIITLTLTLLTAATLPSLADSKSLPTLPTTGTKVDDFVPHGWQIFDQVSGDLNGDGKKDHALILCTQEDSPTAGNLENNQRKSRRPLIVLFSTPDGKLQLASQSPGAVMWGTTANDNAITAMSLKINKGNLELSIGNGSTTIGQWDSVYRYQHKRFQLIGMTETHGRTDEGRYYTYDTNLNTSYEIDNTSTGVQMDTGKSDSSKNVKYYFLRAGKVSAPPALTVSEAQWPGQPVQLRRSDNVALGEAGWHGPSYLSAELKGLIAGDDLFIACRVTDKTPDKMVSLRLRNSKGRIVAPTETNIVVTKDGELLAAHFALSKIKERTTETDLEDSVQLVKTDASGKPSIILSTSCDAEKHTGKIRLRKSPEIPALENFDFDDRDD